MSIDAPIDPLEQALADLASRIEVTDLDGFTTATMAQAQRARAEKTARRRAFVVLRGGRPRQLLAAAAAIVVLLSALLAVPKSRDAIADLFGVDGLRIRTGDVPTTIAPSSTTATTATSTTSSTSSSTPPVTTGAPFDTAAVGNALNLGSPVTLDAAKAALPSLRQLESAYGPPDAIYLGTRPAGLVTFVWRARPGLAESVTAPGVGLVVQQYPSTGDIGFLEKTLGPGTRAAQVTVEGRRGYWIDGQPHSIGYVDARNQYVNDAVRWATNALVWAGNSVTYRIESSLTQAEAMALVPMLR
jgi:hypothetical protein